MFTGIITNVGTIDHIDKSGGDWRIFIQSKLDLKPIAIGASVACSGCCLTVIKKENGRMAFDVSAETLSKTIIGSWEEGSKVNLETSMKIGDEIGGHIVSGHVDGLATIESITPEGDSHRLKIRVHLNLALFVAPKGSVALDGISLTVNEVEGSVFGINITPHTWIQTTIGEKKVGDKLNMEADMLARYVARQLGKL